MVQSIILGNQVFNFEGDDNFSKKSGELRIGQERGRFELETYAAVANRKVRKIKVREIPDGSRMEIVFSEFNIVATQAFPFDTNVEIISKGTKGEETTQVEISHSKVEVGDNTISFPFSVPDRYEN
jgi:DNA-binding transcriptional regulator of glucitol operon